MCAVFVWLPGINASVLRKDGRDIWNISGGALFSALATLGGSIRDLKLEGDPADVDDLGGRPARRPDVIVSGGHATRCGSGTPPATQPGTRHPLSSHAERSRSQRSASSWQPGTR
jgi:hypothetical protein